MTIHSKHMVLPATIIFFLMSLSTVFSFSNIVIDEDDTNKAMIVSKTVQYLKGEKIRTTDAKLKTIANSVYEESQKYAIDYRLVLAVMKVESNFQKRSYFEQRRPGASPGKTVTGQIYRERYRYAGGRGDLTVPA